MNRSMKNGFWVVAIVFGLSMSTLEAKVMCQRVEIDAMGNGVAAWNTSQGETRSVDVAIVSPSGMWSAPQTLSSPSEDCTPPCLKMDVNGNAIVIWSSWDAGWGVHVLKAALKPSAGSWSGPIILSNSMEDVKNLGTDLEHNGYRASINSSGDIHVVWTADVGGDIEIRSASYINGIWTMPGTVS